MARRSPISGLLTGAVIGLAQDMLGHNPIGIYGIAKTVVGYGASSLGVKLDVENAGARFLVTLGFYFVHSAVYFTVARGTGQHDPNLELAPRHPGRPGKRFSGSDSVLHAGQVQAEDVKSSRWSRSFVVGIPCG